MEIDNPGHEIWQVAILFRGEELYIPAIQIIMGFYGIVTRRPS